MSALLRHARLGLLAGALLFVGSGVMPNAQTGAAPVRGEEKKEEKERHPHIRAAIHELKKARHDLKEADHDFGGHREKAIEALDVAIEQLELALKNDKK